jgi:hypothetical protein
MMNSGIFGQAAKDKNKIAASLQSFKMGRVLKGIGNFVKAIEIDIINDTSKSKFKRKLQLMHKATTLVTHERTRAARNSSVVSGSALEYTVNRMEVEAKRRRMEIEAALPPIVTCRRNPARYPIEPLCSHVQESLENFLGDLTQVALDVPTRKQPSRLVREESPIAQEEPSITPSNGRSFTPTEVFDNLASIKKSLRGKMMDAWIEKKLVPVKTRKAIHTVISKAKEPFKTPPATWGEKGRKALLTVEELRVAASGLRSKKGATWGQKEVIEEVAAAREAKAAKQGMKVTSLVNA